MQWQKTSKHSVEINKIIAVITCGTGARGAATNRKVAGLISGGVIGIFHWHNPWRWLSL